MAARKKPKDEYPPLRMTVEGGRLVPAFPSDYERLDSYRRGSKFLVYLAQDGDRPLVRAWWGTIGLYLKHTDLPWTDKKTASAAIKLVLAMVEPFKMPSGEWSQYPRSLMDLDDTELEIKLIEMKQFLYELTGVDYETLRLEEGNDIDEPFETNPPAPDNDAGGAVSVDTPPSDTATLSPDETTPFAPSGDGLTDAHTPTSDVGGAAYPVEEVLSTTESGGDGPTHTAIVAVPTAEETAWLILGARMMLAALPVPHDAESARVLKIQLAAIREMMPAGTTDAARQSMDAIRIHCVGVIQGKHALEPALVAKIAGGTVEEITPIKPKGME